MLSLMLLVAITRLIGSDIPHFMVDTSPLANFITPSGAASITKSLHEKDLIPLEASFVSFQQIGGMYSPFRAFELAGHTRAAARKIVDPIASMVDEAERELAIGSLAEGLQWAARTLTTTTGKRQSPQRAQELLATVQSVTTEHGVVNYGELNKDILRALYSGLLAEDAYKGQLPCSSQRGSI